MALITRLTPLLLAGLVACGSDPEAPDTDRGAKAPAAAEAASLDPSRASVVPSKQGFSVVANAASRLEVLERLAEMAGFEIVVAPGAEEGARSPVTLELTDAAVESIVARILAGQLYSLQFGADSPSLQRVTVGELTHLASDRRQGRGQGRGRGADKQRVADARSRPDPEPVRDYRETEDQEPDEADDWDEEDERFAADVAAGLLEGDRFGSDEDLARQIQDEDPKVREEAVPWIDSDTVSGMVQLAGLLADDQSVAVRVAAVRELGDSDSPVVVDYLARALEDPAPEVIIEAIRSLEYVGEDSSADLVRPLLTHPSPSVRNRAQEAIDFWE